MTTTKESVGIRIEVEGVTVEGTIDKNTKPAKKRRRLESEIQTQIEQTLERLPWVHVMHNDTGVAQGEKDKIFFGQRGAADIFVIVGTLGRFVALEIKRSRQHRRTDSGDTTKRQRGLSDNQIAWRQAIRRVDATYEEIGGDAELDLAFRTVLRVYDESNALVFGAESEERKKRLAEATEEVSAARAHIQKLVDRREARRKEPFVVRGGPAKRQHAI